MIDQLKTKAEAFEQELKSWSQGSHLELEALRENLLEIEKHIRQQRAQLKKNLAEIADLRRENEELQSVINKLLCTSDEFLSAGPKSWILDLKERCSMLIDAATEVEPDSADPEVIEADSDRSSDVLATTPIRQAETQESQIRVADELGKSVSADTQTIQNEESLAPPPNASYEPRDEEKNRYDNLMTRVERLMSQGRMQ